MAYLAIARKWRPSRFEDLVGQGHVVQTLKNAILLDRVSHAYLFSGARGIGKTSVARIFAKALRCPNVKDAVPCNECPECLAISESRAVDVVEIDGASNNGVEAVRAIRENVVYGAASGRFKIYIIDEVHMLSVSAFNALLKTLEEPPAHVVFVFATTEMQKIPLTIVSRCQRFEFRRLSNALVMGRLQQILETEKVAVSEEGLRTIAVHGDGSLRDSLSLLDQVLSFYGGQSVDVPLTDKQVTDALGVNETASLRGFFSALLNRDFKGVLRLIGENYLAGVDLKHFAEKCLEELRLLYLLAIASDAKQAMTPDELDVSTNHFAELSELAAKAPSIRLERMAQILSKAINQLGWSASPRFVLEMAAIRMGKLEELETIQQAIVAHKKVAAPIVDAPTPAPVATAAVTPPPAPKPVPAPTISALPSSDASEINPPPPTQMPEMAPVHAEVPPPPVALSWKGFVDSIMKKRPLLGALLSHASFKMETKENSRVVHLIFPEGSFYERQAKEQKYRTETEEHLRSFFGKDTTLEFSSASEHNMTASLEETRRVENDALKKTAREHPVVLKMQEVLGAEVIDVNIDN